MIIIARLFLTAVICGLAVQAVRDGDAGFALGSGIAIGVLVSAWVADYALWKRRRS